MPLHRLTVAPLDVDGTRLGIALNTPAPPLLAGCRLPHPNGSELLLGVLGASHVVTVEHPAGRFSEQVSCATAGSLPEHAEAAGYHLESRIDACDEATFRRLARGLRDRCEAEAGWLGGMFPGDDAALTALAAQPDGSGWRWRTWHLYPGCSGGTVVHTVSRWLP